MKKKLEGYKEKSNTDKSNKPKSLSKKENKPKLSYNKPSIPKFLNSDFKSIINKFTGLKFSWSILTVLIIFSMLLVAWSPHMVNPRQESSTRVAVTQKVLGNNSGGTVTKEGPYGNTNSPVKVAYILGQHPREFRAHKAIGAAVKEKSNSFKYCYYLYYIKVTQDTYEFDEGRLNGQNLSYEYAVPDINQENFSLAVDVHASNGKSFNKPYVFVPMDDDTSLKIAGNLATSIKWLYYYELPDYSSPYYTTIPLIRGGTPSIIFEAFAEPSSIIGQQCLDFVIGVDQLSL